MQNYNLHLILNFLSTTLPVICGIFCFTWLFFTCFKIDSDNKLKGNYFLWKNLSTISNNPELNKKLEAYIEKLEENLEMDKLKK